MSVVHLLVNPSSRRGPTDADAVRATLTDMGAKVTLLRPDGPDDVAASLDRAAPERVVAVGGDGLIHRALPALANSDVVLGVVSSGTGNDFARGLGLPKRRKAATRRALGSSRAVDLLRVRFDSGATAWAATVVTAGFSGRVNATANQRSFPRGQLKYTVASFTELGRLEPFRVVFGDSPESDGDLAGISGRSILLAVANTRYFGGGMAIAPSADPTDGHFDVTVVDDVPAWQFAAVLPTVFVGQHVRHPRVRGGRGSRAHIDQPEDVWADGELIGTGTFSVEVVPRALVVAAF